LPRFIGTKTDRYSFSILKKGPVHEIRNLSNIRNKLGRVPVLVVGNSRGDLEMLNYSKMSGHSLQLIVNHDDAGREYEYSVDKMKKLCAENGWIEISMKNDFKTVFEHL
jgi:hypothetical protein